MKTHDDSLRLAERRADKWAFLKAWAREADGASTERPAPRRTLTASTDAPSD